MSTSLGEGMAAWHDVRRPSGAPLSIHQDLPVFGTHPLSKVFPFGLRGWIKTLLGQRRLPLVDTPDGFLESLFACQPRHILLIDG